MEVKFSRFVTVVFVFLFFLCRVNRGEVQQGEDNSRELTNNKQEEWLPAPLPLEYDPYHQDNLPETTERPLRRRRVRKRKRRPTTEPPTKRRIHPNANTPELYEEMEEESPREPSNRRRIGPSYTLQETTVAPMKDKVKVRDPFTALKEEDEKLKKLKVESTTVPLKVKEVLKETTEKRVSLSELLQRKNLSLSELLKGDPEVLLALTENSQETTNNINRNFESSEKIDAPNVELQKVTTEAPAKANLFLVRRKEIITNRMSLKPKLRLPPHKEQEKVDGPVRLTIDLESTLTKSEQPLPEKLKNVTAKEELMEILKDPIGSERLARILEMRNMTLEELIQQRERGSSNLHLSDIFHSEKREPEPKDKPLIGKIIVFPTVKVIPVEPPPTKARSLQFPEIKPTYTVTSFPTYKIEMPKSQFFPVDSFHEGDSESSTHYSTDFAGIEDIQRIEDVENRIAEAINEKLNVELDEETSSAATHSGVKSAILASAIIVGASLSVFLTIFMVFKWTQKQKRRLNYCDSFTRILESERNNKRSIRTIMTETLGRKKSAYYQQNLQQSMSDVSWESESNKKPYQ